MYKNITLGADPEVFLQNKQGKLISSIGLVEGTKEKPKQIGDGFSVLCDNVSLEFNMPPCTFETEWKDMIAQIMGKITTTLAKNELSPLIKACVQFEPDQLNNPSAWVFGCDPDYNAYSGEQNDPSGTPIKNWRAAAGHVHIGYEAPDMGNQRELVKTLDIFLGIPSVILSDDDSEKQRRNFYGKAGAFRYKPYGVEYRTLSNFWLTSEELTLWVWRQTHKAIEWLNEGNQVEKKDYASIQYCINGEDKNLALELIEKYKVMTKVL